MKAIDLSDFDCNQSLRHPLWGFRALLTPHSSLLVMATLFIAMTLSACGFQLRGQAAIPFQTVHVEAPGFSTLPTI